MKRFLLGLALAVVLLATAHPHAARAAMHAYGHHVRPYSLGACNGDPIVQLDNGYAVDLTTHIADSAGDVTAVYYDLYVPTVRSATLIGYTGDLVGKMHVLHVYSTEPAGVYVSVTNVQSTATSYAVTATLTLYDGSGGVLGSNSVVGTDHANVWVGL